MINDNFKPIFQKVDNIKERMRNCTTAEEWQNFKGEYKALLATAMQVYSNFSTEEKFNAFKERENSAITAIYQKVKKLWNPNPDLEETVVDDKPKQYVFYDKSNYEADFAREVEYWQTELFPMAAANRLMDWQITIEYNKHLQQQYWYNMCCNPNITFDNEMRIHYGIYKKEYNGENVPADRITD